MRLRKSIMVTMALALLVVACGDDAASTTVAQTGTVETETTAATATTAPTAETGDGGTLYVSRNQGFDGWVLDSAGAGASYQTDLAVFEPLLRFGPDGTSLEPGLAKEWDFDPDALAITFILQDGARFSNGDPVTWEDVAFSLEVWGSGPNFGLSFGAIESVTGDGNTVVMSLAYPDNTILPVMASSVSGILPRDFAGMTEDDFYANPIGAGAFQVEKWSVDGQIVLIPNEFFYDPDRPYVDKLVIDVIPDPTTTQIKFDAGDVAIVEGLSVGGAMTYDPVDLHVGPTSWVEHMSLNVLRPPFDDPLVRQAVAYAIDFDSIGELNDYAGLPNGILPPNIGNWVLPTKPYYRQDLERARELISQSSAADGADVELLYMAGVGQDLVAQIIQGNLADIGMNVTLTARDTVEFLDRAFAIDADITVWAYGPVMPDMSDPMAWIMATGWLFSGFETDTLFGDFLAYAGAPSEADQQDIVAKVQDEAIDNAAVIALSEWPVVWAVSQNLTGFEPATFGLYYWDTIAFSG